MKSADVLSSFFMYSNEPKFRNFCFHFYTLIKIHGVFINLEIIKNPSEKPKGFKNLIATTYCESFFFVESPGILICPGVSPPAFSVGEAGAYFFSISSNTII